jgi:nucleoside-diphosphate-sugar epimerase
MNIVVLGANGYLGSYLIKRLALNHRVIPVTRATLDLTDYNQVNEWLNKTSPDVVINCAVSGGGKNVNDINYSDVQRDLTIFLNFYNNIAVKKYINIGSGAEFDRRTDIDRADEYSTLQSTPLESYGFTKNIIARMILKRQNFFTLRLFGCFDSSEPDIRLFRKFKQEGAITIQDKYFDFISAEDFATIAEHYCISTNLFKDLNCVYERKLLLSEQLKMFAKHHVPNGLIDVKMARGLNYTGDGLKLARLKIPLKGLEQGIKDYE